MHSPVKYDLDDFCKFFTLTIGSGKDEKKVKVSAALLSKQSHYFQRACSESWSGPEKILNFPDEEPETFEIFMAWLNVGDIKHASSLQRIVQVGDDDEKRYQNQTKHWLQLLNCYFMGDYIQAPKYTNVIMDALIEVLRQFEGESITRGLLPLCNTCVETIDLVWDKTQANSPLRNLIVDYLVSTQHASFDTIQNYFFDSNSPQHGPRLIVPDTFILEILRLSFQAIQTYNQPILPWLKGDADTYSVIEELPLLE